MNKIHTLADRIGITLTPMQETVADRLLHTDRNIVVLSPTGSGKTFAYLLPLVAMIDATRQEVQAVVVVPGTRVGAAVAAGAGVDAHGTALDGGLWRPPHDGGAPQDARGAPAGGLRNAGPSQRPYRQGQPGGGDRGHAGHRRV